MDTVTWAALGIFAGLILPWCLLRLRARSPAAAGGRAERADRIPARPRETLRKAIARRFHGVSIREGLHSCPAAQALRGQRFLSEEAPALPLAGCDQKACQCAYAHHRDRRDGDDRRVGWGSFDGFTPTVPGGNRRASKAAADRRRP
jgi:hypothetical protein